MKQVAINGFGRIGRNILRALLESPRDDYSIFAVNDSNESRVVARDGQPLNKTALDVAASVNLSLIHI